MYRVIMKMEKHYLKRFDVSLQQLRFSVLYTYSLYTYTYMLYIYYIYYIYVYISY